MARPLKFKLKDYDFISHKFPKYHDLLVSRAFQHGNEMWIEIKNESDYDSLLDNLCLELGDALNDNGELNADGLRFEEAWDYADREGVPFGEK
ncbi:hypothetical protein H5993_03750 [Lactobacillus alvi]|uniref:Uncharacterized protein n=1 Tax=Limosilactobacillus alvi TaxID=990412 RepID=A0ABS2EP51_9LACO|nr:hypothetical protein [Limosilactobacillus alvi]MBM6753876.1 hypothetical protein [Limosilactobacillus alvi]